MADIFNGKMKYLFLVPIAMIIFFAWLNNAETARLRHELFEETKTTKQEEVDLIANFIDKGIELGLDFRNNELRELLMDYIANLNSSGNVFTGLYDNDLNLISSNSKEVDCKGFDPLYFDIFDITRMSHSGWITDLHFDNGQTSEAPLHMYYRWVPDASLSDESFLVTVGIAHESIAIDPARLLTFGLVMQMVVTFVINVVLVLLLCYLGTIYRSRSGAKWRSEHE